MATVNIMFSDATETVVIAYFAGPQDPEFYPNQATMDTSDPRWKTFYESMPDYLQEWLPRPD